MASDEPRPVLPLKAPDAPPHRSFESVLATVLARSVVAGSFSTTEFFTKWFRQYGQPVFVLFNKNLRVTNIQFAELLALVRTHTHSTPLIESSKSVPLIFTSQPLFNGLIGQIVEALTRPLAIPGQHFRQ
jgi:hypothetical protein